MSTEILPTAGRVALAQLAQASKFLFAVSRGNPAWDSQWTTPNPPTPSLDAENVLDLIGYARPTLVDFVVPDANGSIRAPGGERYAVSATRTRRVRVRLSLPVDSFADNTIREIGLFINPIIDASVPAGDTLIPSNKVTSQGDLFQLHWREPLPIEDGDHFARNFIVRI